MSHRHWHGGARLGESSYSLYLVHFWTVMGLGWLLGRAAVKPVALTVVVCSLTLAIACGMLLHHLIERPVIDLLRGVRLPNWRTRPELVDAGQSAAQAVFVVGEERPGEGQSGAGTVRVA